MLVAAVGALTLVSSTGLAANQGVTASGVQFSPTTVTITQGDSVSWTNAGGLHDVTFDDGSFQQPSAPSGSAWTVTRTFDTPGTFQYHCSVHGTGMSGTVVVNQATQSTPGGSVPGSTPAAGVGAQGQGQSTACKSQRNFRIRIRQPRGVRIKSAEVSVNGKPVEVSKLVIDGKLRHTARIDLRGLGRGTYKVEIDAVTDKGKKLRGTRSYQTCAAKLVSNALPPL
jgi:plastocyanin